VSVLSILKDWVGLVAALVAACASVATLLLSARLQYRREQRKALWEQELRRFLELEESAGKITEDLLAYGLRAQGNPAEVFDGQHQWLKAAAGRFRRYPDVHRALIEFNHCCAEVFQVERAYGSAEQFQTYDQRLQAAYQDLLKACDKALRRPSAA
jgi:hypothetical protein